MRLFRFASQVQWCVRKGDTTLNVVTQGVASAKMAELFAQDLGRKQARRMPRRRLVTARS